MSRDFHRPAQYPGHVFDTLHGADDPAETSRIAHETATALISRVRDHPDRGVVDRLVTYTDEHGIDEIAQLWSRSLARTLPGVLWRLYLMRLLIRQDPHGTSFYFRRGLETLRTIDPIVAGATEPFGPQEIITLADRILRGVFSGDFAVALERAAAFCRVASAGCTSVADDLEPTEPHRSTELTRRGLRFSELAVEFADGAGMWRNNTLD